MRNFKKWVLAGALLFATAGSITYATSFSGATASLSITSLLPTLDTIYARLNFANTFTAVNTFEATSTFEASNTIQVDGTDERVGLNITKDGEQRSAMCLSRSAANLGTTRSFCLESDKYIMRIVGNNNNIFGTGTSSTIISTFDYNGGGRTNMVPTGTMGVASGNNGTFNTGVAFSVGGTSNTTSTFQVDTTNDWSRHLPITQPADSECDNFDESGRLFYDQATHQYKYCNQTKWSTIVPAHKIEFDCSADATDFYVGNRFNLSWDVSGYDLEFARTSAPVGGDIQVICEVRGGYASSYYKETDINSATSTDIAPTNGPTPNSWMDCIVNAEDDSSWPQYNISFHNIGDSLGTVTQCAVVVEEK